MEMSLVTITDISEYYPATCHGLSVYIRIFK